MSREDLQNMEPGNFFGVYMRDILKAASAPRGFIDKLKKEESRTLSVSLAIQRDLTALLAAKATDSGIERRLTVSELRLAVHEGLVDPEKYEHIIDLIGTRQAVTGDDNDEIVREAKLEKSLRELMSISTKEGRKDFSTIIAERRIPQEQGWEIVKKSAQIVEDTDDSIISRLDLTPVLVFGQVNNASKLDLIRDIDVQDIDGFKGSVYAERITGIGLPFVQSGSSEITDRGQINGWRHLPRMTSIGFFRKAIGRLEAMIGSWQSIENKKDHGGDKILVKIMTRDIEFPIPQDRPVIRESEEGKDIFEHEITRSYKCLVVQIHDPFVRRTGDTVLIIMFGPSNEINQQIADEKADDRTALFAFMHTKFVGGSSNDMARLIGILSRKYPGIFIPFKEHLEEKPTLFLDRNGRIVN